MDGVIVWGEVLFCIDFSMDFCALYFTCKLLGWRVRLRRLLPAAAICAGISVFCTAVLSGAVSAAMLLLGWLTSAVILAPRKKRKIRMMLCAFFLFLFLEACAGGIMTVIFVWLNRRFAALGFTVSDGAVRHRLFFMTASAIFVFLGVICRIISRAEIKKLVKRNGTASVQWNGHETVVPCLFDSGNLVSEPISGKPVMILPYKEQYRLGVEPAQLENGRVHGSRLIPLKTLDRLSLSWGILPDAVRLQADRLDIPETEIYIVFSRGTEYAIVPTAVLPLEG